ncbi:Gfo/Idh/MocA family oxidoreductase [Calycomorphotria hydatis]|uniref:Putative oxidoreductase YdgJ n=1 Tax=Calycomorphotria hydatis TaxID=2528027 RepID=A0A517TDE6_9PLAN|nr:Gfo/Idh/MocA family oxidoreductase [Calycomorphotria hydatis]QDT66400.1 putative oxidoreductase YdgJ [Calycomorphotria hydatis]
MHSSCDSNTQRRQFLKSSAAAAAATMLPAQFVRAQDDAESALPPSERVNLAAIGFGGMGATDLRLLSSNPECNVVALCDIDLTLGGCRKSIKAHPSAKVYNDFRVMFDEMGDDIDAVLIATPDHTHFCIAMAAMALGKHVYVEKPLAHSFQECDHLMAMAEKSGVVTQMGNQGHSEWNYWQFKAWQEAGVFNDVRKVIAFMNRDRAWTGWSDISEYPKGRTPEGLDWDLWVGPATEHPFSRKLHPYRWRGWFDYGSGCFGDWGPHILDTCHEFLHLGMPTKISALKREGANPLIYPQASTIQFEFPARDGMPACEVTWYDGKDNRPDFGEELNDFFANEKGSNPFRNVTAGKVVYAGDVAFQSKTHGAPLSIIRNEAGLQAESSLPSYSVEGKSKHHRNFIRACKGEEATNSPFAVAAPLTQVFNLGVIAQRLGGELEFDRESRQFKNNKTANTLLAPPPRKGWEQYYEMV